MPGPLRDPGPGLRARMRQRFGTGGDGADRQTPAAHERDDDPATDEAAPDSDRPDGSPTP